MTVSAQSIADLNNGYCRVGWDSAFVPMPGEGRRHRGEHYVGTVQGDTDRAGRAGRGLLYHPCRRASQVHPTHSQAHHWHCQQGGRYPRQGPNFLEKCFNVVVDLCLVHCSIWKRSCTAVDIPRDIRLYCS